MFGKQISDLILDRFLLHITQKMARNSGSSLISVLAILVLLRTPAEAKPRPKSRIKTEVFLSPEIALEPGLVSNKYYYGIDFPPGHIGIKSFNAELVDEGGGNSVPLHQTYLHHWVLQRYYAPTSSDDARGSRPSNHTVIKNSGLCDTLTQYFGIGAETRRTATAIPDPYAIEVGNPPPAGYEEGWMLNVHAIDTRGAGDSMGCAECRCGLYNVAAPPDYAGGLRCCRDGARCRVEEGLEGERRRRLYLRYTVKYVEWDPMWDVPVRIYILDVTDDWVKGDEAGGIRERHHCAIEYDVESCGVNGAEMNGCIHSKTVSVSLPSGGDMIYGVGHQHAGGTGTALYGEGGRVICLSNPSYGNGNDAGNEAGYIVGMSTCYPSWAGPVKIGAGETLTLVSNYSSKGGHTGVMGLFYLLLADSSPELSSHTNVMTKVRDITMLPKFIWSAVVLVAGLTGIVIIIVLKGRNGRAEGYEAMS